jgi:hypothetical protein
MTTMSATSYTRFVDPRAFMENQSGGKGAAKAAKPAKVIECGMEQTATFATFAEGQAENCNTGLEGEPWTEGHEERAAIIEHDGAAPRAWAEALARLDPSEPPSRIPLKRWQCFIDDCGHFLDDGWAGRADALGWGPLQLFGCDRNRPFAGHRGLLWEVNGCRLIELHRDRAIIETTGGAYRCYRRRPVEIGRVVLAWDWP